MEEVKDTRIELAKEEPAQMGTTSMVESKPIKDAEWCFQFFDNEPVVFAWNKLENDQSVPFVLELQPVEGQGVTFSVAGMTFKIFSREITEATKIQRQTELEQMANLKKDMESSENK
jgi:hypothetical protein